MNEPLLYSFKQKGKVSVRAVIGDAIKLGELQVAQARQQASGKDGGEDEQGDQGDGGAGEGAVVRGR